MPIRSACIALLVAVAALLQGPVGSAEAREPMLIPGKRTLYERILTRPDAELREAPGDSAAAIETLAAFEIFYVYGEQEEGGRQYLEVGRSLSGGPEGWLARDRTIRWRQTIVVGFNNPAGRERSLIYRTREDFDSLFGHEDIVAYIDSLRHDAVSGETGPDSPVISIEPETFVDITEQFYLLPILEAHQIRLRTTRQRTKLLRIASLPLKKGGATPMNREEALRNFKVGITFVIDTTQSMGPYIEAVREAVNRFSDRIRNSAEGQRFRFGLIGFRDNVELAEDLGYVTKVFLPLSVEADVDRFLAAIDTMTPANVNSHGFNEDSVAGVNRALKEMDWEPFGGRFIILVTDAGPRDPGPDAAERGLAAAELRNLARNSGVGIFTMHLKTPEGRFDHENAERAYGTLSRFEDTDLYYGAAGGNADEVQRQLEQRVEELAAQLGQQVTAAMEGRLAEIGDGEAGSVANQVSRVGRAMQLAYLGRAEASAVPEVFEGWLTDRDPIDRRARPLTPYLLMSRNQLSTLHTVMERAIEIGNLTYQDETAGDFFTNLREAVALITRRPQDVQAAGTLGDLLGEYLEGLPYSSVISGITPANWRGRSAPEKRAIVDQLQSKLPALRQIHDNADQWIALVPGAPDGEHVTLIPLSLMP